MSSIRLAGSRRSAVTGRSPITIQPATILGRQVEIIAEPRSYGWDFGDGQTTSTETPGAPYPAKETTHEYTKGDVQASLDGDVRRAVPGGGRRVAADPGHHVGSAPHGALRPLAGPPTLPG